MKFEFSIRDKKIHDKMIYVIYRFAELALVNKKNAPSPQQAELLAAMLVYYLEGQPLKHGFVSMLKCRINKNYRYLHVGPLKRKFWIQKKDGVTIFQPALLEMAKAVFNGTMELNIKI